MAGARHSNVLLTYLRPQARRVLLAGLLLSGIALQIIGPSSCAGSSIRWPGAETPLAQLFFPRRRVHGRSRHHARRADRPTWLGEQVARRATNAYAVTSPSTFSLDMSFHTARTPGELIERVDGDTRRWPAASRSSSSRSSAASPHDRHPGCLGRTPWSVGR